MTAARSRGAGAPPDNRVPAGCVAFVIAALSYALLGTAVSHMPPAGVDAAARGIAGEAPGVAWVLTESCLWPVLTALGLIGCIVAVRAPAWRARIIFAIVTTIVAWQTSNLLKDVFDRPRPGYWIVHHETSYSYSSGHAMFATIVYWLWAYYVARSPLPAGVRLALSRLALGAHYPSDLVGGVLLGIAMLALAFVIARVAAPSARVL